MRNKRTRDSVERVTLTFTRLLVYASTYSLVYSSTSLLVYDSTRFQKAGDAQHAAGIDQALGEDPEDAVVNRAHRGQEQAHQGEGHAGDEQRDGGDFL